MKYKQESEKCQSAKEEWGKKGDPTERLFKASRTKGSEAVEEVILATRAVLIARMKRLSGRRVMLVLSEEILGLARQERASAGPIMEPGT